MAQYVTINGNLVTQTEKAWLVDVNGDETNRHWIAKSQIHEIDPDTEPGDEDVDIVVNEWYYQNKLEGKL